MNNFEDILEMAQFGGTLIIIYRCKTCISNHWISFHIEINNTTLTNVSAKYISFCSQSSHTYNYWFPTTWHLFIFQKIITPGWHDYLIRENKFHVSFLCSGKGIYDVPNIIMSTPGPPNRQMILMFSHCGIFMKNLLFIVFTFFLNLTMGYNNMY